MTSPTYPDPISEEALDRFLERSKEMGWKAEVTPAIRHSKRIHLRLVKWLQVDLGLSRSTGLHPRHPNYQGPSRFDWEKP